MGPRGLFMAIVLVASALALVPTPAKAVNPTISNIAWTPWVPAYGEYVTVEADVSSPGGPPTVEASWCILPPWTCIPFAMSPIGGERYRSNPIYVADEAGPGIPSTGAHFNVSAKDPNGNLSFTPEIYVQYASLIAVDATLSPAATTPSQPVSISGMALYQSNASVPAKFSTVGFEILETGMRWSTVSDEMGAFASDFNAPASIGSYTVRTTVSNRSLTGSQDRYLAVATAPTPDLGFVASSLVLSPSNPTAGEMVTISVSVENRGTAPAGPFSVLINVTGPTGLALSRPLSVPGLEVGEQAPLSTTWTAAEGSWTVTVLLDTGHQIDELSESNNRQDAALAVAPNPQGLSAILIVGVSIVGVGVAAAAAFVYLKRARRGKEP